MASVVASRARRWYTSFAGAVIACIGVVVVEEQGTQNRLGQEQVAILMSASETISNALGAGRCMGQPTGSQAQVSRRLDHPVG